MPEIKTQKAIREYSDKWARLQGDIAKAQAARDKDLAPHVAAYDKAAAPILEKHNPKIEKLTAEAAAIQTDVFNWLTRHDKAIVLTGELATATNTSKPGDRVIDPQKFFAFVKEQNAAFWDCLSVGVAKAKKLIGEKAVDGMAVKTPKLVQSLTLNQKK
jgi:hypothetical protein